MSGVYGQPKREHWELDYLRTVCAAEGCETRLQMLRRSHCRKCGKLFCPKCVGEGLQRRLNVDADFAERGVFCAVCFECYTQNNGWFSERGSAAWIEASSGNVRDWTEELVRERRSCQAETRRKERLDKNAPFSSTWKAAIALKLAKDLLDVAKGRRRELDPRGKTHWVNARSVAVCDRTACRRAFTLNERRHHCRVCGKVYCDACSPKDLNLTYFLTDPDASGEGGESTGGEEDALASLGEGEQLPLQRGCAGCKRDLERMRLTAHTRRLVDGAGAHVLRNLYHPVSGYVAAIKGAMSSLERSVGYLERMCELAGPQDGDSVHLATADVLELKAELLDLFRKYEKRFGMILKWDGWKYAQLLGEGRPVVDRDGTVREDLFVWRGRVCSTIHKADGTVVVKADTTYDTVSPGEVLFQGIGGENVEEQLRVLSNLRQHFTGFWSETYHLGFKSLVERSQLAMLRASDLGRPEDHSRLMVEENFKPLQLKRGEAGSTLPDSEAGAAPRVVGHLLAHIIEAADLDSCGVTGSKLKAFAAVRCAGRQQVTKVQKRTGNPVWSETFSLPVLSVAEDLLEIEVASGDTDIGTWTFGVQELVHDMEGSMRGWVPLCPPSWGTPDGGHQSLAGGLDAAPPRIRISVKWIPEVVEELDPALLSQDLSSNNSFLVTNASTLVESDDEGEAPTAPTRSPDLSPENSGSAAPPSDSPAQGSDTTTTPQSAEASGWGAGSWGAGNLRPAAAAGVPVLNLALDPAGNGRKEPAEGGGGGVDAGGGVAAEEIGMEDRIEALKGEYVRIYLAFAEVRGWRSDAEVGALLDANTAAALERALTLALEAVGSALQATVTAHGGEWKTFRSKVVASVKAAGTPAVLFPPEDRVKLARAGAGAVVGRGAVVEAPSPTGGALGRWGRRTASPGGGDKSPPCGDQRMEIAGDVLRRAEQSMAGAMEQMERVGAGPQAHPQAHDTMAQARDTIQTLTSKVAEHRA